MRYLITICLIIFSVPAFSQNKAVTQNTTTGLINGPIAIGSANMYVNEFGSIFLRPYSSILGDQYTNIVINNGNFADILFNGVVPRIGGISNNLGYHGILGRTVTPIDGIGVIGWSSSGAAAVKAKQDTYFNSPALSVVRNFTGRQTDASSPALKIFTSDFWNNPDWNLPNQPAFEISNPEWLGTIFKITWDGTITSSTGIKFNSTTTFNNSQNFYNDSFFYGTPYFYSSLRNNINQPIYFTHARGWHNTNDNTRLHPMYKGSVSTAPATGNIDTSMVGDTYFNTSDNRMYILTPNGWRAITSP